MVLLKNAKDTLPLKAGKKIAVVGPMGDTTQLLFSDYETAGFDNTDTIFSHLTAVNTGGTTTFVQGVSISSKLSPSTTWSSRPVRSSRHLTQRSRGRRRWQRCSSGTRTAGASCRSRYVRCFGSACSLAGLCLLVSLTEGHRR